MEMVLSILLRFLAARDEKKRHATEKRIRDQIRKAVGKRVSPPFYTTVANRAGFGKEYALKVWRTVEGPAEDLCVAHVSITLDRLGPLRVEYGERQGEKWSYQHRFEIVASEVERAEVLLLDQLVKIRA